MKHPKTIPELKRALSQSRYDFRREWSERMSWESKARALAKVGLNILATNGGPVDAKDTVDGTDYVLVSKEHFLALQALIALPYPP